MTPRVAKNARQPVDAAGQSLFLHFLSKKKQLTLDMAEQDVITRSLPGKTKLPRPLREVDPAG
jgi:hypothetical protein